MARTNRESTMDQRAAYLIQILEKMASPLVAAISEKNVRRMMMPDGGANDASLKNEAQQLASLVSSTTQMSIALSEFLDIQGLGERADPVRVALTAVASPLVANFYRLTGRYPSDQEIERLKSAMSTVVTFADNFSAAGEQNARLSTLDDDFKPMDPDQQLVQYMFVLLPVVNSVLAYPFGQNEKKLLQEVCDRLIRSVRAVRLRLFADMPDVMAAKAEIALLRGAALIYSQCHFAEMAKLMAAEDQQDRSAAPPSMDDLWAAVDERLAMLDVLADALVPGRASRTGSASAGAIRPTPAQAPPPAQQPPAAPPPAAAASAGTANPMSFFAKKG